MSTKHTPGPWAWFDSQRGPYLATPDRGRLYVMGFARKGMQGALPRFAMWDGIESGVERQRLGGIMEDGVNLRNGEMHPDARVIEEAPNLLDALQELLDAGDHILNCDDDTEAMLRFGKAHDNARDVIGRATGTVCKTCNGRGEIGGVTHDGSSQTDPCPECRP